MNECSNYPSTRGKVKDDKKKVPTCAISEAITFPYDLNGTKRNANENVWNKLLLNCFS